MEFLNTVRVSCSSLGGGEFGEDHRLVDDLDGVVHDGQLEHRGLGEVAAFAGFPLVVLLDQHRPGQAQQSRGVGEHTDVVGIFPGRGSLIRLVGAVLAEQHDEWIEGRRYLGLDVLGRSRLTLVPTDKEEQTTELGALSA